MIIYHIGSRGEMVKQIQKALHLYPDGIYGRNTQEAVVNFQRENGLKVDGIVGPATLAKLLPCRFKKSKRRIDEIIVHCTATPEGQDKSVDQIRVEHKQQGWSDIGYHYVVYRNGSVHDGRDVDIAGAHCQGHNAHSIGVAYVGGVKNIPGVPYSKLPPKDTRTEQQKAALLSLLLELRKLYPTAKIYGHRDFAVRDCPSFDARQEYRRV